MKTQDRRPWQANPESLMTEHVQLWADSGTMMGVISQERGRQLIREGRGYAICDQAVGLCEGLME
jgi:hypothetical protein